MRRQLVIDAIGVLGLCGFVEGVREISRPAAFMVGGVLVAALAFLLSRGRG